MDAKYGMEYSTLESEWRRLECEVDICKSSDTQKNKDDVLNIRAIFDPFKVL